jgi:hypothetical protein
MGFDYGFVITNPEALLATTGDVHSIGGAKAAADAVTAARTGGVVAVAADEVSVLPAAQFAAHADRYQAVSAQAAAVDELFANALGTSARSYAATEAANAFAAS